ncbi:hypothetical protein D3C73_1074440 [compost metagenome]
MSSQHNDFTRILRGFQCFSQPETVHNGHLYICEHDINRYPGMLQKLKRLSAVVDCPRDIDPVFLPIYGFLQSFQDKILVIH